MKKKPHEELTLFIMDCCTQRSGKVFLLMCLDSTLVTMSSADVNCLDKYVKHFNEAKYLGWKLFASLDEAQVWIRSAGLEVIDLTKEDNTTVATSVCQSVNDGGNDISGDCNLHAEQLQMYNHDININKDVAQKRINDDLSQTTGKTHVDTSQVTDAKMGTVLKGKPAEISAEGFDCGNMKLNFTAEGNTELAAIGIQYDVSSGIPHKTDGSFAYMIGFKKISGNLWMLDNSYFLYLIQIVIDQYFTPQGIEPPLFLQTFKSIAIRDPYKKTYKRNKKGYVDKKIFFTIVKTSGSFDISTLLSSAINTIHSFFKESTHPPPGHTFVDWLAENKNSAYEYELGKSAKSRVSEMTKDQLKTKLNLKLVHAFSKHNVDHNQALDKYLCDSDIKEFLHNFCGYNSFEEIPHELRKAVFSKYPKTPLPNWNTVEREEY